MSETDNKPNQRIPYGDLGARLKRLRERSRESLAEVSGAVEINEPDLLKIESGTERPSEDILLLLISHYAVEDDKAAELWELAGYDHQEEPDDTHDQRDHFHEHPQSGRSQSQTLMVMIDPRVMYSDNVEIITNREGVVLNFSQVAGQNGQTLTVSRIGMSHEQAKMLMGVLHQALYQAENKGRKRLGDGNSK